MLVDEINEAELLPHMCEQPRRREKWAWLTEGIEEDGGKLTRGQTKRIIAEALLENLENYARTQKRVAALGLMEDTLQADVSAFITQAFPMVRRVYPKLLATELFTTQVLTQPSAKVFYFDHKYGDPAGGGTSGNRIDVQANFAKNWANSTEGATPVRMNASITSAQVDVVEKKIRGVWSIEAAQDAAAYHQVNLEEEVMQGATDECTREIDRTLIDDCFALAGAGNVNFNINGAGSSLPSEIKAYNEQLYEALVDASNNVFTKRYRNPNWVIAGAAECGRLEKLEGFKLADLSDSTFQVQHGGRHLYGTLQNRWVVYKDPWFTVNSYLMGYKGLSMTDAGYMYCPFIALWLTPLFIDPNDMQPRRGLMSRFGYKMVVSEMYSTVTLTTS